jgi:hypothetical protein
VPEVLDSGLAQSPGALVYETDKGPRLLIASEAARVVTEVLRGHYAWCASTRIWHWWTGSHWNPSITGGDLYRDLTEWMYSATYPAGFTAGFTARYQDNILTLIERGHLLDLPDAEP